MWKLGLRLRSSRKGIHKFDFPCSAYHPQFESYYFMEDCRYRYVCTSLFYEYCTLTFALDTYLWQQHYGTVLPLLLQQTL
jgi:hypothetical protein